jgi:transcriptional regulator with XRE-family HTH domain
VFALLEMILELKRELSKGKGRELTQKEFAELVGSSEGSVSNWETTSHRPLKSTLLLMAGLATPDLARRFREAAASYSAHPGKRRREDPVREFSSDELPADIAEKVQRLAKKRGLDTSVILLQALRTGLAALSRDSSPAWKTLVKRQADIARRVEDREHPAESSRKHRRSKVA